MAWRRKNMPERIKELQGQSYEKHREKRITDMKKYNKTHKKTKTELEIKNGTRAEYRFKYAGNGLVALNLDKQCICCGNENDLIVHHFNKNKEDNELKNLVTLCRSCHATLHNKDRDFGGKNNYFKQRLIISGVYLFTIRDSQTGEIKRRNLQFNLIPTVGRAVIANQLTSASPSPASPRINYTTLGTGTNAPANADTQLQTETYRKAVASQTNASNVAYCTAFYTAEEVSGTFREAGMVINGTGTANSGTLFSRVAINITKSTSETLTVDYSITIS